MKIILKSIAAGCLCFAGVNSFAQNTILNGNIKGLDAEQVVISYAAEEAHKSDTVKVKDGKFIWKANIKEPQQVYMMLPRRYFPLFVESGKISLTGIGDSTESYVVKGSKIQDEATAFEKSVADIRAQESKLYKGYGKGSSEDQLVLETKLEELAAQRRKIADEYIKNNPSSFYSIHLVSSRAGYGSDYSVVKKLFDVLDDNAKETAGGKKLAERLDVLKRSAIGAEMIDFTQNDTSGKAVRFADMKGKYILVDFWASWCGPCRAENPNVLKAYDKYRDKNFTVLGISLDDKGASWKKAIRDDKMPWVQLSDLKGWKNEVSTYYGIQGIPSNLLIDPSGKIIARDLRGELLHKKLAEILN